MRNPLFTRILSMLLLVSLLLTEISPSLAYGLEAPLSEGDTAAEETFPDDGSQSETTPEDNQEETAAPEEGDETGETVPSEPEGDTSASEPDAEEPSSPDDGEPESPDAPADDEASDSPDAPFEEPEVPDSETGSDSEETPEVPSGEEDVPEEELSPEEQAQREAMIPLEEALMRAMAMRSSDTYSYATELAKFPASYQSYLKTLHAAHPNWVFVAVDTGLTWDQAISAEYGTRSTLECNQGYSGSSTTSGKTSHLLLNNHSGYYSATDYSSTNHYKPLDGRFVSASRAAIAYYMDPRNFLTEKYIFQFEDQTFNGNIQQSGVTTILRSASIGTDSLANTTTYVTTSGDTKPLSSLAVNYSFGSDYSSIIYNVGLATDVSPYFLASRIVQETGGSTSSKVISGNVSGYTGYYNFYNIGAYASASGDAYINALKYAVNKNWSNPILAIYGGAQFLAESYISKGQNTLYYSRFNVNPDAVYSTFTHQYMSATTAAAAESTSTYRAYSNAKALDSSFLFYIPVYGNMPSQTSTVQLTPTTKGVTTEARKLYAGPSDSTSSLVTIPSGATVTVQGGTLIKDDDYWKRIYFPYWYKVTVTVSGTSYTGYIQEQFVKLSSVYNLKKGSTQSLSSVLSTSGTTGTIYYETSDPAVATVSDSGVITAVGNGTCSIYAVSGGGSFDAIGITVSDTGSTGSTAGVPATPSLTGIANVSGGVQVAWSQISGAVKYQVYRRSSTSEGWSLITTVTTNSYKDTSVTSGQNYIYTVRAVNSSGTLSGYVKAGITIRYLSVPRLSAAAASSDGITVRWSQVTGAIGYRIYRKVSGGSWTLLATMVPGTTIAYTDGTAVSGTIYIYTVRAQYGSYLSSYVAAGISAKAVTTGPIINCIAKSTVNYRTGAGTSYSIAGQFAAGSLVQVVPNSAVTVSGTVWYKVKVNNSYYYVSSAYLLLTPSLKVANTDAGIAIAWSTVSSGSGYYIYRKTAGSSWSLVGTVTSASTTSFTDKTAVSGTSYTYTVRAYYGSVRSLYDTAGKTLVRLSTPSLSSATASSNGITVIWNSVTGAQSYIVYRKLPGGSWSILSSTVKTNSYTDSSAQPGTTYIYTVRAVQGSVLSYYQRSGISATMSGTVILTKQVVKADVNYRSKPGTSSDCAIIGQFKAGTIVNVVDGWSQTVNSTVWYKVQVNGSYYYVSGNYLLGRPSLTKAVNVAGGIQVTWSKISSGAGYYVYRKTSDSSWKMIANITSPSTITYVDKTAASGTAYTYTVRAYYGSVQSYYVAAGISCLCLSTPALSSASASSSGITVKWAKVTGAQGYYVYRKVSGGKWSQIAKVTSGSTLSYLDQKSLSAGTTYIYTVRAYYGSTLSYYVTSGISAIAKATSNPTLVDYVTTGDLNYRTGPGTNYALAGTLKSGTTVKVVSGETYDVNGTPWFKVYINGSYYYMSSKYLKKV